MENVFSAKRIREFFLGGFARDFLRVTVGTSVITALFATAAIAAEPAGEKWIAAWSMPAIPLPPGTVPLVARGAFIIPAITPLGASVPLTTPRATPPRDPIPLDNPGNIPLAGRGTALANVTTRQLVRVSAAGRRLRLRFSNEESADVLVIGAVHVGKAAPDGTVLPGTDRAVTFSGRASVAIPASAPLISDAVDLPVNALDRLVISVYTPGVVGSGGSGSLHYVSGVSGDQTAQARLPNVSLARAPNYVSMVEIDPVTAASVVVALGDSITEGYSSTTNGFKGWPDRLAERLSATPEGRKWAVANAGIGGNRFLHQGTGLNVLARLDRDVLSVPGVKAIIMLEGINDIGDIGRNYFPGSGVEPVTLDALKAAMQQVIIRAHEHGIRVIGGTLPPFEGATSYNPASAAVREGLNSWIATSGAFDGVIDFAAATSDPAHPARYRAGLHNSDNLHPVDAGYAAMGDAIDLKVITGGR